MSQISQQHIASILRARERGEGRLFLQLPPRTKAIPASAQAVTPRWRVPPGCPRCALPRLSCVCPTR